MESMERIVVGLQRYRAKALASLRERMRGAVYDVVSHVQLAKTEAITRNRPTRFVVDVGQRQLQLVVLVFHVFDEKIVDVEVCHRLCRQQ